ncbi:hypothetical protein V8E53_010300 [Lactarius tabidus]
MSTGCSALNNAIRDKGLNYSQLAGRTTLSERRISEICSGKAQPSTQEFNALASALGINPPAHASR